MGEKIIYEVHAFLPENDEPTSFYFDSYEAADLWLSDFDDGGISEVVIGDTSETDNEEIIRAMEEIERLEHETKDNEIEKHYELDYDKMKEFKYMYENGKDYEPNEEEYEVFKDYKNLADRLTMSGYHDNLECLSCPGFYRITGDNLSKYGSETFENCEIDCARAYEDCEQLDFGEMDRLYSYFLKEKDD